ncbi:DNA polymerase III subunit delta [Nostoc sp. CHAB 5715]|uniref:DNA polymerase III subunit delta n=1 Tax=Nostoc sp. CHAB 5715 TaxID=2780400 RepID=UPI001E3CE233|nr:DNA polymerase III subunit delta [Nostoc sp. CHAB 5715]
MNSTTSLMPIQIYWGEDEFLMHRAIGKLLKHILDRDWNCVNYSEYSPSAQETIPQAFADIMTPPVGSGGRLVHLPNSSLLGVCPKTALVKLEHILPAIPETNVLLITSLNKPDARNKSVQLLLTYALAIEFPLIPQWQTDALIQQARTLALEVDVNLTADAYSLLVESTGNNTRLTFTELEKLKTYAQSGTINADMVRELVSANAANSLQLANAIRLSNVSQALKLIENLINCNEPALRIVATLTTAFRTWLIVKLMAAAGCKDDSAIAQIAELKNPKRLYYIRQEVKSVSTNRLQNALKVLLELELMLKSGGDEKLALQTQIIKLCS